MHQQNVKLIDEFRKWENEIIIELKKKQMIEYNVDQLEVIIQQFQLNNKKLENHINEWKLMIKESQNDTIKYCKEIHKMFATLKKIKFELICICSQKHHK